MAVRPYRRRMAMRNLEARLSTYSQTALAVFRIVVGLLWLCHGLSKVIGWPMGPAAPVGLWPDFYAGWIELITGALITLGLFTRAAAFVACGEMAVAYFTVHFPNGFFPITNGGEGAVLFCFAFLLLVFLGAGAYALDARRRGAAFGGPSRGIGTRGGVAGGDWADRRAASRGTAGWRGSRADSPLSRWWQNRRFRGR